MSRKISIIGSICIFIVTILSLIDFRALSESNQPKVKEGVMDLTVWNFDEDGMVQLDGSWAFYPGKLIIPNSSYEKLKIDHIEVPGNWNEYVFDDRPYGTYHLQIDVPEEGTYGLMVRRIRHSNRMYINGVEAGASGNPSEDRHTYQFGDIKYTAFAESINKRLDIVIQVANYGYPTGGIVHSIHFGTDKQIKIKSDVYKLIDAVPIIGCLLLFLIYFCAYLQQGRKIYELYFSLFCLSLGLYVSLIKEKLLLLFLPGLSPIIQVNIQLFLIHSAVLFLLLFIYCFFKPYSNRSVVKAICILLSIQILLFGIPKSFKLYYFIPIKYTQIEIVIVLAASYIYILIILIRALFNKVEGSEYVLVVVTSFSCYGVLLGLNLLFETDIGVIPLFLFLTMVISLSSLMGFQSRAALVEKSSQEAINQELSNYYAQITPHFLYNTLNTIIGLSYKDEEKAREALQYLAIYFRAKLDYKNHLSLVSIEEEVELVQAYLAIEKLRFGERLVIKYDIDEKVVGCIPSMTIQPLIENAVQHGIAKKKDGGTVCLSIKKNANDIEIVIKDDGIGISIEKQAEILSEQNTRIGFINPIKKIKLIKNASFKMESTEGNGTKISIKLPEVKSR